LVKKSNNESRDNNLKINAMKKLFYYLCFSASFMFLISSCTDVENWNDVPDNIPPGKISNVMVENLNGGAIITYTLPPDDDLLGVKALYSFTEDGKTLESFSSSFRDTIELTGFPDTNERIVQLICLDKSKNESEPLDIVIQPLEPAVKVIRESLTVKKSFGGVIVNWDNPFKEDIGVSLFAADSTGEMVLDYTFYSNMEEGQYFFRGFEPEERRFQIQLVDRWDNVSERLDTILTPLYEIEIPRFDEETGEAIWKRYGWDDQTVKWRGDLSISHNFRNLIDGNRFTEFRTGAVNYLSYYVDNPEDQNVDVSPAYMTIDLGYEYVLTRHKRWDRKEGLRDKCPKDYEIWGTIETPKGGPSDFNSKMESLAYWTSWSEEGIGGTDRWKTEGGWVKLGEFHQDGPISGATTVGAITAEDQHYAMANGLHQSHPLESTTIPVRYIRVVFIENWIGSSGVHQSGWHFWGAPVE
jgi:hypothetical protein